MLCERNFDPLMNVSASFLRSPAMGRIEKTSGRQQNAVDKYVCCSHAQKQAHIFILYVITDLFWLIAFEPGIKPYATTVHKQPL